MSIKGKKKSSTNSLLSHIAKNDIPIPTTRRYCYSVDMGTSNITRRRQT